MKITSSKTQLKLNEKTTISVKLIDFSGNGVSGRDVVIKTNNGNFIQDNTIIGQSYTFSNINSNGASIDFKMNTSGVANIVVEINNIKKNHLQVFAHGYEKIQLTTTNAQGTTYLYVDEYFRRCILYYVYNGTSLSKNNSSSSNYGSAVTLESNFIPSQYATKGAVMSPVYRPDIVVYISGRSLYYRVETNKTLGSAMSVVLSWTY